jgi:hypothetical protein
MRLPCNSVSTVSPFFTSCFPRLLSNPPCEDSCLGLDKPDGASERERALKWPGWLNWSFPALLAIPVLAIVLFILNLLYFHYHGYPFRQEQYEQLCCPWVFFSVGSERSVKKTRCWLRGSARKRGERNDQPSRFYLGHILLEPNRSCEPFLYFRTPYQAF